MNNIKLTNICKAYGETVVVNNLNLEVKQGERLILLGPSGCGKTTTLRMIAGLESITSGELEISGKLFNTIPPGERNIAMVFQSYALFPHLTVWENIIFGLKIQKLPSEEIKKRAAKALEILNLTGYESYRPKELSGGQKQRVALCRALVKQSPYFLLDEPLSNLDAQLRQQARTELVKIHEIYKPTMIYVTHDQVEAMTVAHKIAILNKGTLQQIGTPKEIYNNPANTFVAGFIGTPPMNLCKAHLLYDKIFIGNECLVLPEKYREVVKERSTVVVGIRPERCTLEKSPMVEAKTVFVEDLGNQRITRLQLKTGEEIYVSTVDHKYSFALAQGFSFEWENVCFFDVGSGKNLIS
ncbi:MAG: ABC transporter ATP-binding protein [Acidaminococcaceae bacterium]|nr:ABC transporter ATP-binding protein [Acidaminococcaceae bacterium]